MGSVRQQREKKNWRSVEVVERSTRSLVPVNASVIGAKPNVGVVGARNAVKKGIKARMARKQW
jgi:hypothetical protein